MIKTLNTTTHGCASCARRQSLLVQDKSVWLPRDVNPRKGYGRKQTNKQKQKTKQKQTKQNKTKTKQQQKKKHLFFFLLLLFPHFFFFIFIELFLWLVGERNSETTTRPHVSFSITAPRVSGMLFKVVRSTSWACIKLVLGFFRLSRTRNKPYVVRCM